MSCSAGIQVQCAAIPARRSRLLRASTGSRVALCTISGTAVVSFKHPSERDGILAFATVWAVKHIPLGRPGRRRDETFGRFAGGLTCQAWHEITRQTGGETRHELARPWLGDLEMRRTAHRIEQMQVVGQNARFPERFGQFLERLDAVV